MHALSVSLSLTLRVLAIQTRELRRGETNVWLSLNLSGNFVSRFHSMVKFNHEVFVVPRLDYQSHRGDVEMQLKFHPHPLTASLPPSPLSTQIPRISLHLASAAAALVIRPSRMRDGNRRKRRRRRWRVLHGRAANRDPKIRMDGRTAGSVPSHADCPSYPLPVTDISLFVAATSPLPYLFFAMLIRRAFFASVD